MGQAASATRDAAINIRATSRQRDVIDRAAAVLGTTRTDFVLDASCRAAEDVLLDRRYVSLDPEAFDRFSALLDSPPPPTEALRRLLGQKAPWE